MSDVFYRIIDASHGAVLILLLLLTVRLLILRRNENNHLRYVAGFYLFSSAVQMIALFFLEDEARMSLAMSESISIWMDAFSVIVSISMLFVLFRNRYIYDSKTIRWASAFIILQWIGYGFCAVCHFSDWTYFIYLPLSGLFWCMIGLLIDRATPVMNSEEVLESQPTLSPENKDPFLSELDAVLTTDRYFCSEDITRDAVCRRMFTNRTTFSQRLSAATGMTFTEYLREMRLREAARLLSETDMTIDQIVYEVGLKSVSGFHRNFLLSFGITPRKYRENAKPK